jgi:hypothetical protein
MPRRYYPKGMVVVVVVVMMVIVTTEKDNNLCTMDVGQERCWLLSC